MSTHPDILAINDSLMVIVDIQTKLLTAMPEKEAEQMLNNSRILLEAANCLAIPVLLTEQYPKGLGSTDPGISDKLAKNTPVFDKTGFSCLAADGFTETLNNTKRKQIILVGQETHVCILQTALDLLHNDYHVHIAGDATCSRNREHKLYALQRMQQLGATITCSESVIFEWLQNASHPDFKTISRLLR